MTGSDSVFYQVLAAFWLVGGALAIGLFQAVRNRRQGVLFVGWIYALVFSWIYVGWLAGKLYAWIVAAVRAQGNAAAGGKSGENR